MSAHTGSDHYYWWLCSRYVCRYYTKTCKVVLVWYNRKSKDENKAKSVQYMKNRTQSWRGQELTSDLTTTVQTARTQWKKYSVSYGVKSAVTQVAITM